MLKNIIVVAVLAIAANNASAIPIIDFTGIAAGAQVLDYYNGGTDSTGKIGFNYGVRFDGGTIVYDEYGPRLQGYTKMTFAADILPLNQDGYFGIGFLAMRFDVDGGYTFSGGDEYNDAIWVGGTGNPHCYNMTSAECKASGWRYISPEYMGGYVIQSFGSATSIGFDTDGLDNIEFGAAGRPAHRYEIAGGEVPEPASIALFSIAGLGIWASRRRKIVAVIPA